MSNIEIKVFDALLEGKVLLIGERGVGVNVRWG